MNADHTIAASRSKANGFVGASHALRSRSVGVVTSQGLSPEVVDRAITVATVFGRPGDFADFVHDFTGEAGQAQRAAVAVRELLRGRAPRSVDPSLKCHQLAKSILQAISEALAGNIGQWPDRLFEEKTCVSRGLEHGRMACEYIAAGLQLLAAMADSETVRLAAVVGGRDVKELVALLDAAMVLRGNCPRPVFGKALSFVRIADRHTVDSWNGYDWVKAHPVLSVEASAKVLARHYASRGRLAQAALTDIIESGADILRQVAPAALSRFVIGLQVLSRPSDATVDRSRVVFPFTRTYTVAGEAGAPATVVQQVLSAKEHTVLAAANRLDGHRFDEGHFHRNLERLVVEGFVDTAHGRERAVEAAREVVAAYLDGLERMFRGLRYRDSQGRADAERLARELDELLTSLAAGPIGADIEKRFHTSGFPRRLEALREPRP